MSQIANDAFLFLLNIYHTLLRSQAPFAVKNIYTVYIWHFLNVCQEISQDLLQLRLWGRLIAPSSCSRA